MPPWGAPLRAESSGGAAATRNDGKAPSTRMRRNRGGCITPHEIKLDEVHGKGELTSDGFPPRPDRPLVPSLFCRASRVTRRWPRGGARARAAVPRRAQAQELKHNYRPGVSRTDRVRACTRDMRVRPQKPPVRRAIAADWPNFHGHDAPLQRIQRRSISVGAGMAPHRCPLALERASVPSRCSGAAGQAYRRCGLHKLLSPSTSRKFTCSRSSSSSRADISAKSSSSSCV